MKFLLEDGYFLAKLLTSDRIRLAFAPLDAFAGSHSTQRFNGAPCLVVSQILRSFHMKLGVQKTSQPPVPRPGL